MNKRRLISIIMAVVFFAGFAAFTYAVKTYDVQAIGPLGSEVGFATFNKSVYESAGQSELMYELTQVLGYLAILICALFGVFGAVQLFFTRKSLLKVDLDIICLGIFYLLGIGAYIFFEFKVINFGPMLKEGELASSYPSSHTMLAVAVFSSLIIEISLRIKNRTKALLEQLACLCMITIAVVGRLLSGRHWATDIIAGVILSIAFVFVLLAILPVNKKCIKE